MRDCVDERELDVVALTETWLGEDEPTPVSELCGEDITFVHQPRGGDLGGDVGVLFRKTLQLVSLAGIDTHASETYCVILRNVRIGCTTRVIVVYRQPMSDSHSFMDDVGEVFIAAAHNTETVVCRNFITRYGDPTCTDATNLADLLETSRFVQHARSATHERGETHDLVITSETSHDIATAAKPTTLITDHYAIECGLHQQKPKLIKRHVEYRKYAAIDNSRFAADLAASGFHAPELYPAVILSRYDVCLRTVVDAHASLISWTITVMPMTPWHTSELAG